jgi:hypothetical protein
LRCASETIREKEAAKDKCGWWRPPSAKKKTSWREFVKGKGCFVACMQHDMRCPLRQVIYMCEHSSIQNAAVNYALCTDE